MKHILIVLGLVLAAKSAYLQPVLFCPEGDRCYSTMLQSGPQESTLDIVIMGDGFTWEEQDLFNRMADSAMSNILNAEPFSRYACALNFWRVNVVSLASGIDDPDNGVMVNTGLDSRFGSTANGEAQRCITSDSLWKCYHAAAAAPAYDHIIVLCNQATWGGCGHGNLLFTSIGAGFQIVLVHEMGHILSNLADEYNCYVCDGSDSNRAYPIPPDSIVFDPGPNLSLDSNAATVKWRHFIDLSVPIILGEAAPPGQVYVFEGGGYYARGVFRPEVNCKMRSAHRPFCLVCRAELENMLQTYCGGPCVGSSALFPECLRVYRPELLIQLPPIFRFQWEFPPCLSCPDDALEVLYGVLLEDLPQPDMTIQVRDKAGQIIAQGFSKDYGDSVQLSFMASRFDPAVLYVEGKGTDPVSMVFAPRLFINQVEVPVNEMTMQGMYRQ